jgi:hypothetical protein
MRVRRCNGHAETVLVGRLTDGRRSRRPCLPVISRRQRTFAADDGPAERGVRRSRVETACESRVQKLLDLIALASRHQPRGIAE